MNVYKNQFAFFFLVLSNVLHLHVTYVSCISLKDLWKQVSFVPRRVGQLIGLAESCSNKWININVNDLQKYLQDELFGQQIATTEIPIALDKHWSRRDPKYLLLTFYGSPGTGKTLTTKLINKHIFKKGSKSYYYLFYSGSDSYLTAEKLKTLKEDMVDSIKDAVEECPFSVIVFDEADKYPSGFLDDVVTPFTLNKINVPNKRAVFIFLTNVGSSPLIEKWLEIEESYFRSHHIGYYDAIVTELKSNGRDSFYRSNLVANDHIQRFIPFLPHKKESFLKCLDKAISQSIWRFDDPVLKSNIHKNVLNGVTFLPETWPIYSSSGCKRIQSLVLLELGRLGASDWGALTLRSDDL